MEKDDEWNQHTGASNTSEWRQYDPRLGRWKSGDPEEETLPWQSPYAAMDNNPIELSDPNGDKVTYGKKWHIKTWINFMKIHIASLFNKKWRDALHKMQNDPDGIEYQLNYEEGAPTLYEGGKLVAQRPTENGHIRSFHYGGTGLGETFSNFFKNLDVLHHHFHLNLHLAKFWHGITLFFHGWFGDWGLAFATSGGPGTSGNHTFSIRMGNWRHYNIFGIPRFDTHDPGGLNRNKSGDFKYQIIWGGPDFGHPRNFIRIGSRGQGSSHTLDMYKVLHRNKNKGVSVD